MTTKIETLAAEALADDSAATPGPWVIPPGLYENDSASDEVALRTVAEGVDESSRDVLSVAWHDGQHLAILDADLKAIASARTREPQLAAWVQKVAPLIEQLRGSLLNGASIGPYSAVRELLAATKETP